MQGYYLNYKLRITYDLKARFENVIVLTLFLRIKEVMIIRPDLKPLYLCHDIKDICDWIDLRVYDILLVYGRGKVSGYMLIWVNKTIWYYRWRILRSTS